LTEDSCALSLWFHIFFLSRCLGHRNSSLLQRLLAVAESDIQRTSTNSLFAISCLNSLNYQKPVSIRVRQFERCDKSQPTKPPEQIQRHRDR